jgi:Tfp pilus assembly protein PilV
MTDRRPEGGFTMIEVLVAILLTALTVIGVLGLYKVETRASANSRRQTEASVFAQDKLEELRTQAAPAANVPQTTDYPIDPLTGVPSTIFTRNYTIDLASGIASIRVWVTWDDDGTTQTIEVHGQRGTT